MMETEGGSRLNGSATPTDHGVAQRLEGHTGGRLRVLNGDLEGVPRRKDSSQQHLFVYQQGMGHILDKALAMG